MSSFEELHRVAVRIGGRDFDRWQSVDISYGIETAARSFAVGCTRDAKGIAQSDIALGDPVEVYVGPSRTKRKVLTGHVDTIEPSYDATGTQCSITGRSRTGDLVDSSVVGKRRFNRQALGAILISILEPHEISAVIDGDPGELVERFSIDVGDKCHDAIEELVERYGFLVYDDADGDLRLLRAVDGSFERSPGDVLYGLGASMPTNVLSADGDFDATDVYRDYRCRGQSVGTDDGYGELAAGIEALERTSAIGRARTLVLTGEGTSKARCLARVQWEAATRLGRASTVVYTVKGWYRSDGGLWQPGTTVEVDDPYCRVDGRMLIVNVSLKKSSEDGTTAEIVVAPEYGYYAELPKSAKRSIGAWRSPV